MTEWDARAACRESDPALFFPDAPKGGVVTKIYAQARAVCMTCEVREDCLDAAMEEERGTTGWRAGMRGGLTPSERDRHAKRVRFCACCGGRFVPSNKDRYCSEPCRREVRAESHRRSNLNRAVA